MSHEHINQPGLVLTPGPFGWCDSERVSSPQVLHCPDGTWKMWYYGRDASFDRQINLPTGRCGLAISTDGIRWQRVQGPLTMGAVFEPHPDPRRFDSAHVGVSNVLFYNHLYWMWYFGGDSTVVDVGKFKAKGLNMRPGCAISRDGMNWVRIESTWDARAIGTPCVVPMNDGSFRMYYIGANEGGHDELSSQHQIGLAISAGANFRSWHRWGE